MGAHPKSAQRCSIIPGRSDQKATQSQVANCKTKGEAKLLDSYRIVLNALWVSHRADL